MLRLLLAALLCLVGAASALAGTANGYSTVAPITSSFCSFTPTASSALCSIPTGAICAYITITGQAVNWTDDGSTPTTVTGSGGQQALANDHLWTCGNLSKLKFIQLSATAIVAVSYYK